jgi:hypothetical protein
MATGLFNLKQVNQAISQGAWSGYIAPRWVEYLVVSGGGGGGGNYGGGGGGGGLLTGIVTVAAGTSYTVTIGSGGTGSSGPGLGATGVSSVFGAISATGGGGGGGNSLAALSGGSGGGGTQSFAIGQGTSGQGNAGGLGYTAVSGGGGGGAGTVGLSSTSSAAGNGGAGIASAISGTVVTYAGGGGGYATSGSIGAGGVGGGGAGAVSGGGNTGGGGGGWSGSVVGNGGSGIVVVRYPGNVQFYTGGTVTYSNGYIVHNFTANGTLAPTTPTVVSEYQISRSLRFNSADSTYLNRTLTTPTNNTKFTLSMWIKRSSISATNAIISTGATSSIYMPTSGTLVFENASGVAATTAVFRDFSAWYHLVFTFDSANATANDRMIIYVNNVRQALSTNTTPSLNATGAMNSAVAHYLGSYTGTTDWYNGYLTETNFIDGQALTPTSFGYVSPTTGIWSPAKYVGGYGTNGFYLNFSDNSNTTAATLGKDYSGNGNNWTPNNFSVTAGAGNDSLVDSPTSYGVDTGVGGTVRGNYSTMNPLWVGFGAPTFANGNLDTVTSIAQTAVSSMAMPDASKTYFEATITAETITNSSRIGIRLVTDNTQLGGWVAVGGGTIRLNDVNQQSSLATFTTGDVIGVAVDLTANTLQFYKNGSTFGTSNSITNSSLWVAQTQNNSGSSTNSISWNYGQRPFAYTAPSGFKALCTQNLPTPTIGATSATLAGKYFNPVLYTGTGASQSITGVGFQPDWVWIKSRSNGAYSHRLVDAVRGATKEIYSNLTNAEGTDLVGLTAFGSDGFTLGSSNEYNVSGGTFVSWNWRASNATAVTNTSGILTSQVSANTTAGFSVCTYTAPASSQANSFGHGLGVAPSMVLAKNRSSGTGGLGWAVYHSSLGANQVLSLNTTAAAATVSGYWGSGMTSTVVGLPTGASSTGFDNCTGNMVAYCFAPVAGYSAFGSYTGNGSADGPFVFTGMRPAYIMVKRTDTTDQWTVYDSTRNTSNLTTRILYPNLANAEDVGTDGIDMLSNGIKMRNTYSNLNASGGTYIYMAFASNPFKYSLAR